MKRILLCLLFTLLISISVSYNVQADETVDQLNDSELSYTWQKVTSINELSLYSDYIIVAAEYDYAMSYVSTTNNFDDVSIVKDQSSNTCVFNESVWDFQVLTLVPGLIEKTYALKLSNIYPNKYEIAETTDNLYLKSASNSSNILKTEDSITLNSSWSISILENSTAVIKSQGDYSKNLLRYNSTSNLFSCYSSGQKDICLYKRIENTGNYEINFVLNDTTSFAWNFTKNIESNTFVENFPNNYYNYRFEKFYADSNKTLEMTKEDIYEYLLEYEYMPLSIYVDVFEAHFIEFIISSDVTYVWEYTDFFEYDDFVYNFPKKYLTYQFNEFYGNSSKETELNVDMIYDMFLNNINTTLFRIYVDYTELYNYKIVDFNDHNRVFFSGSVVVSQQDINTSIGTQLVKCGKLKLPNYMTIDGYLPLGYKYLDYYDNSEKTAKPGDYVIISNNDFIIYQVYTNVYEGFNLTLNLGNKGSIGYHYLNVNLLTFESDITSLLKSVYGNNYSFKYYLNSNKTNESSIIDVYDYVVMSYNDSITKGTVYVEAEVIPEVIDTNDSNQIKFSSWEILIYVLVAIAFLYILYVFLNMFFGKRGRNRW